jgi:solute carrier family 25 citrate transporter 1
MEAVVSIWKDDGIRAFWRGTIMRLGRTVLAGGVLFTTAEAVAKIINPIFDR